jgi:hypothetical protein
MLPPDTGVRPATVSVHRRHVHADAVHELCSRSSHGPIECHLGSCGVAKLGTEERRDGGTEGRGNGGTEERRAEDPTITH